MYQHLDESFANGQDLANFTASKTAAGSNKVVLSFQQPAKAALLRIAYIAEFQKNAVDSGENAGETLSHTNVVKQLDSYPIAAGNASNPSSHGGNEQMEVTLRRAPTA